VFRAASSRLTPRSTKREAALRSPMAQQSYHTAVGVPRLSFITKIVVGVLCLW
jgi:hypothetical protein